MAAEGHFREDLLQRINAIYFYIPPLSERRDDIPILVKHFIQKYDTEIDGNENVKNIDIEQAALDFLCQYEWQTGVRELENCIKRSVIVILSERNRRNIQIDDLDLINHRQYNRNEYIQSYNKSRKPKITNEEILYWMTNCNQNQSEVARKLGVNRKTIQRRLKSLSNQ
jgi:two-component system nitrogen regulation response regulator NtrX